MTHVHSQVPVSAYGVSTSVGAPGVALPAGILMTGLGAILLFVAFHNVPSNVANFTGFLGYLSDEIKSGGQPSA
jgi:hypothetical protein